MDELVGTYYLALSNQYSAMPDKNYFSMSDEELLLEWKKQKKDRVFSAFAIGFLAAVFLFGTISWILAEEKKLGFFIPMLIPLLFIRGLIKKSKRPNGLAEELKKRSLL